MKIGEYRGKSAEEIERQLARDVAISELSHALYLGREVARKEFEMKAARAQREVRMIVFFDIGSTLIDGPPFGPARRLSEALGLGPEAVPELERILFRSPARDPEQLANTSSTGCAWITTKRWRRAPTLWNAQLEEAYVLPGARELIDRLKSAGIPRAYLSNIWPPFYEHFKQEFAEEAEQPAAVSLLRNRADEAGSGVLPATPCAPWKPAPKTRSWWAILTRTISGPPSSWGCAPCGFCTVLRKRRPT